MSAVGNYELVEIELGPFSYEQGEQSGQIEAPSGKRFLGVSAVSAGPRAGHSSRIGSNGTAVFWSFNPAASTTASTLTVYAPAAEMGN